MAVIGVPETYGSPFNVKASILTPLSNLVMEKINQVLSGEEEYIDWYGNVFGAELRRDSTRVYNHYLEDELEREGKLNIPFESFIETIEFRELIDIWISKLQDHRSS